MPSLSSQLGQRDTPSGSGRNDGRAIRVSIPKDWRGFGRGGSFRLVPVSTTMNSMSIGESTV